jgi:KaiC/GvpD/RAD55 family RecA-like ATPase
MAYSRAKDATVTYFTVRSTAESVREDMDQYNWDVSRLEAAGNWKFKVLPKTSGLVEDVVEEMKNHRTVVIDSFSEVLLSQKMEDAVNLLCAMSRENQNSEEIHLLLLTKGMQEQRAEAAIQHFAESVLIFNTNWNSDVAQRDILIKKMKGTFAPSRKLPYSISRRGLLIETATRIT